MKITVYTIADDPFCKEEKEYLTTKNLQFEERNLESDRKVLEEMLALSDNFAGVPFTVVTKDDGTQLKLKGFTKEEFEEALLASKMDNISQANSDMKVPPTTEPIQRATPTAPDPSTPAPSNQVGSTLVDDTTSQPTPATTDQPTMSQPTQPSTPPINMADSNPQKDLEGILSTLSSSGGANEPTAPQESAPTMDQASSTTTPSPTATTPAVPTSPTTPAATTTPSMPSIPDFKSE